MAKNGTVNAIRGDVAVAGNTFRDGSFGLDAFRWKAQPLRVRGKSSLLRTFRQAQDKIGLPGGTKMGLAGMLAPFLSMNYVPIYGTLKVRQLLVEPNPLLPDTLTAATLNE